MDRTRRRWGVGLVCFVAALGACDDSTGPDGADSQVAVHAYIDADGSGDFSTGDTPLPDLGITLASSDGAVVLEQSTGADGIATFTDVPPGSYEISYTGTAPAGAVLATATNPVVVAPFNGAEVTREFRFTFMPGTIEGVLFRDENGDGDFDADVDLAAPGITVDLYAGSDTTVEAIATTSTDSLGGFSFTRLRPGQYTVVFTPFPTMQLVGGNTQTLTVGAQQVTPAAVEFTGNLISTIAEARAAASAGALVAVRGVVVSQPAFSDELFIQDETAGIQVYAADVSVRDLGLERGDTVVVVGTAGLRFGEVQISDVADLRVEGTGPAPAPTRVAAAEINAGEFQGELVKITGATVTAIDTLSFDNQFVTLTDAAGNEFGLYADSRTGVTPGHWSVGTMYNVAGVVGYDSRYTFPNRIEVRGPEDVEVAVIETIADARAMQGETVAIEGVVTVDVGAFGSSSFYIQDATGGIAIYEPSAPKLVIGDRVRITGPVSTFNDEVQINNAAEVVKIGTDTVFPVTLSIAAINAGQDQGELATVQDVTVQSIEIVNSFGTQEVTVTDAASDTLVLYVDNRTGITEASWTVGATYDVTGIVSRYRDLFELKPRRVADVQPAS